MQIWIVPCFLILFMQAGFALLEMGLCRAKNAAHTTSMSFLSLPLAAAAFFIFGFGLMSGGSHDPRGAGGWEQLADAAPLNKLPGFDLAGHHWGIAGARGFVLISGKPGTVAHDQVITGFLFMLLYVGVGVTIPTGALAERWSFKSFCLFTLISAAIIFPLFGCWMWGGGWLAQLGTNLKLGHGAVDYSGSSVVHLLGGTLALIGAWRLGPRIGKYDDTGRPRPILGHNVPMVLFGTLILGFGWLGFNTAPSFAGGDGRGGAVAVNTLLASAAGTLAAAVYMWWKYGRPDPSVMCNGMLGGLVASCASCGYVQPWAAFVIGAVAGLLAAGGVLLLERRGIDDPVGAISVHGLNGIWGMLALGIFADGTAGHGLHHIAGPVKGLLYGGGSGQLVGQLIAVIACAAWGAVAAGIAFWLLDRLLGVSRVSIEIEIAGLDIPELGAPGYPEFVTHLAPEQLPMR